MLLNFSHNYDLIVAEGDIRLGVRFRKIIRFSVKQRSSLGILTFPR
ncbi:hypothetical protein HNQ59_003847 [Chitinivorax tropicus]|uniref:Uncharacterized protein n=1 Tax=Chitinivorax tropicus TaxID=714531 RepID=A0A840MW31_9PROT|nr:hypothetical protein [Chitinivorax tropicus]